MKSGERNMFVSPFSEPSKPGPMIPGVGSSPLVESSNTEAGEYVV